MLAALVANVVLTSLLSAALTWVAAYWYYTRRLSKTLEGMLLEIQQQFEQRVKSGVLAAGEELLPAVREQVKLGFQDAFRESQTAAMVEGYATAMNRSADLLGNRLGGMFGIKPRK